MCIPVSLLYFHPSVVNILCLLPEGTGLFLSVKLGYLSRFRCGGWFCSLAGRGQSHAGLQAKSGPRHSRDLQRERTNEIWHSYLEYIPSKDALTDLKSSSPQNSFSPHNLCWAFIKKWPKSSSNSLKIALGGD